MAWFRLGLPAVLARQFDRSIMYKGNIKYADILKIAAIVFRGISMKKYCFIVFIIILVGLLISCSEENDSSISNKSNEGLLNDKAERDVGAASEAIPEQIENEEPDNSIYTIPDITPEQNLLYQNEELGFELTFPESWAGWYTINETSGYVINESKNNAIEVCFYGKSNTATAKYGLHLFLRY